MFVFDTNAARTVAHDLIRPLDLRRILADYVARNMPATAQQDEFTEALLFVLSIRLNRLTGGAADMTFSARCHLGTKSGRGTRLVWALIAALIDLYCALLRGEVLHCETAWYNHTRRLGARRPG